MVLQRLWVLMVTITESCLRYVEQGSLPKRSGALQSVGVVVLLCERFAVLNLWRLLDQGTICGKVKSCMTCGG